MVENSRITDNDLQALKGLAHLMDKAFTLPGTNIKFGLDSIIGLVPFLGDTISVAVSTYIYSIAKKADLPWHVRSRMIWNIFIDWLIGLVPFAGDLFDVGWKANSKNIALLEKHLSKDILEGRFTRIDQTTA